MTDFKRISCQAASELIKQSGTQVIDVRDQQSFASGHIKDALFIDNAALTDFIASANADAALVIYCYHGNASQQAGQFFIQQGFEQVYSVDGGFEQWKLEFPNDLN